MDSIIQQITQWVKDLLISGILSNLSGMFDDVNQQVGQIANQVGKTPANFDAGVFSMIKNVSETVIVPIAGIILTFIAAYELVQMVVERNNMHDVDTWMFFRWTVKTFIAVVLITNTWNIIMGIFDLTHYVVNQSADVIVSDTSINIDAAIADLEVKLSAMELGPLFGLWFQSLFIGLTMTAISICIFIIVYGRMLEIYLMTSLAPIPLASMANREQSSMGQNYLRSLFALGFQAFLLLVCVGVYGVLVRNITINDDIIGTIWGCLGYTVLLCFALFKTGSLAKSIFSAH